MKKILLIMLLAFTSVLSSYGQRALSEEVNYFDTKTPNQPFDASIKTYKVVVETPYTLTVAQVEAQSLVDFEEEKAGYSGVLTQSEAEFQKLLANYDGEVEAAEKRYEMEMKAFKALSLIERLAMTEQGMNPKLVVPSKPTYVKPREPKYEKPNLNEHLIFDNEVLAAGVELYGYEKGSSDVLFIINISKMIFQDNAGQTFYSQPTTLKVMKGTQLLHEKGFDDEFQFLTSSASNTINLESYEKNNVTKIMKDVSTYVNNEFGHVPVASTIRIEYPKNKDREYDALENAKIKAVSAYRKLNAEASLETRQTAKAELEEVRNIWSQELAKVNYTDKKALMNKDIAKMIFTNLLRVDISLKDKAKAEETLSAMQQKRIDLDLNYDEKQTFTRLEEQVYKMK